MYTHRDLCKIALAWLLTQPGIDLTIDEIKFQRGIADVLGITTNENSDDKKIAVIEVKRSRADLLGDLRERKMLKYEATASHCYLAATAEALGGPDKTSSEVLKDLTERGLPAYWGVLLLPNDGTDVKVLRGARRKQPANPRSIKTLTVKIAKSYMYKQLKEEDLAPTRRKRSFRRR